MNGVGSRYDRRPSPPSNLSPIAPRFSVNRPNPKDASAPFVNSSKSLQPQPHPHGFFKNPKRKLDSTQSAAPFLPPFCYFSPPLIPDPPLIPGVLFLSPITELDSSQTAKPCVAKLRDFNSVRPPPPPPTSRKPSSAVAEPYCPIQMCSPDPIELNEVTDWFWNHDFVSDDGKSKQVADNTGLVGEERMNQGCQDLNGEALLLPHQMCGQEKYSVPINADQLEDKPCRSETVKPVPVDFSATSFMGSPSVPLETCLAANSVADSGSGNLHLSYSGSYDKHLRQHDKPSGVDTVTTTPITGLVMDLNDGNTIADGDPGNNNFYNIKQAYQMTNPGTAGSFDLSHLKMHLERDEHSSSTNAMISDKNVSRDTVNDILKERHRFQNPHARLDNLSFRLGAIEDVNSVEKSFEGADRCNAAVDSPCWKGAPPAHFSCYEASVALPPEYLHKKEECFGSAIQEPQKFSLDNNNNLKYSCENSNSYHYQETSLAGSPMKCSVTEDASEDCNSYGTVNAGSFQSESSYDCGLKYLDDTNETKENSVPSTRPTYVCESGSSHSLHQVLEENKLVFQKQHTLCFGGADAGSNVNKRVEQSAPYPAEYALFNRYVTTDAPKTGAGDAGYNVNKCIAAPFQPEYDQFKRSLAVDAPNTLEKSAEKVSAQELNVQMLVDSMHNLSELLLIHFLNDACKLKERDHNVLKNVINNLNTCALKDAEQIIPAQEFLSPKPETSGGAGESCELQQNSNSEKLTKVGPESSKVELENSLDQEAKNLHLRSENPHGKLLDYVSSRDKAEMTKEDKMTKALKKILSENFHDDDEAESQTVLYKNLWLEAEAALCSVSYRARYNQMKIEIKNHSNKKKDTEEQSNPEVVPSLSEHSATKVHIDPNHDSFVQDLLELNSTFLNCKNGLQFSADMSKPYAMIPEVKYTQDLDSSIQNSTISCTNKDVEDDDASVTSRFRVLKASADKSSINTSNLEEPSDIADKLAPKERDNQKQINLIQDSPIPGKNKADYVASLMARFHILKSWLKDSSSISSERKLSDDDTIIAEDDASEGNSFNVHVNPSRAQLISFTAVEKSVPKEEYLLDFNNPQEIPLCGTCKDDNQLPTYYSDDLASDWEYV